MEPPDGLFVQLVFTMAAVSMCPHLWELLYDMPELFSVESIIVIVCVRASVRQGRQPATMVEQQHHRRLQEACPVHCRPVFHIQAGAVRSKGERILSCLHSETLQLSI